MSHDEIIISLRVEKKYLPNLRSTLEIIGMRDALISELQAENERLTTIIAEAKGILLTEDKRVFELFDESEEETQP